jgi:hypothetical protein
LCCIAQNAALAGSGNESVTKRRLQAAEGRPVLPDWMTGKEVEATAGIEPAYTVLQTVA